MCKEWGQLVLYSFFYLNDLNYIWLITALNKQISTKYFKYTAYES